jgi:tRNA (guanine-N7-)-methyltransferase
MRTTLPSEVRFRVDLSLNWTNVLENDNKQHHVLSFVRRTGRLDDRLQRAWDRYAPDYLLDINAGNGSLAPKPGFVLDREFVDEVWGNNHPLIVEIGTGQGENIVAAAQSRPEKNFLAVEVYDPGVAHTMLLAGKSGLSNLRIAQINAPELLESGEDGVVEEVWTFFPDPWPKMRHHKRRIVQPELASNVHRVLRQGGVWRLATDIEDYALHVHEVMDGRDDFVNDGSLTVSLPTEHVGKGTADRAVLLPHDDFTEATRYEGRVLTNFEKKGQAAGRVIHDFAYRTC